MKLKSLFSLFSLPDATPVEKWAIHNSKKTSADEIIAAAIVQSFAKDFKHWKFIGEFHQRHSYSSNFKPTSLSRKMVGKKHVEIVFVFRQTQHGEYSTIYAFKPIGCEVNGVRISDAAFTLIYKQWNNVVVAVKAAEQAAAEAKKDMEDNEARWNLAESLIGMKRDGLGGLRAIKTVETGHQVQGEE